jgi:hypothetical protein
MEYLDPKQKRAHEIKLYVGYALMAVLIIIATIIMAFLSFGFNYDRNSGSVVQNGLMFVDSQPESSKVFINDVDKGQTDVRLVVPSGKYKIRLEREGYRQWSNEVDIDGGDIARIVYPFLFPSELRTEEASALSSKPVFSSQSPDRNWLIIKYADKLNEFVEFNTAEEVITSKVLSINPSIINQTGKNHIFKEIEWSSDNRHSLIRHDFDGGFEFFILDRQDVAKSFNLTAKYNNIVAKQIRLRDKKFDKYYILNNINELYSSEFKKEDLTKVADTVLDFHPHGADIVMYISSIPNVKDKVMVKVAEKEKQYNMRELPTDKKYLLDLAEFDGNWYVVLGASSEKKVYVYIDPFKDLKDGDENLPRPQSLLTLDQPIEYLAFSANARFISVQSGSNFSIYDAENVKFYKYNIGLDLPSDYKAKWMDGHRFNIVNKEKVHVFDFDGTNKQELMASYAGVLPFFDRDYNDVFTLSSSLQNKDNSSLFLTPLKEQTN